MENGKISDLISEENETKSTENATDSGHRNSTLDCNIL